MQRSASATARQHCLGAPPLAPAAAATPTRCSCTLAAAAAAAAAALPPQQHQQAAAAAACFHDSSGSGGSSRPAATPLPLPFSRAVPGSCIYFARHNPPSSVHALPGR